MKLSQLIHEAECLRYPHTEQDIDVCRVTSRTDDVCEGTLYFLIKGQRTDVATRLPGLMGRGLAAIVAEELPDGPTDAPILLVPSARAALSTALYRWYRLDKTPLRLVGITGTNGKTTTATLLSHILRCDGHTVGQVLTGHLRSAERELTDDMYSMTTPDPEQLYPALAAMAQDGCDTVVMEVSSHALALGRVAPLRFAVGLYIGLSDEHLDFHTDMNAYFQAKAQLFRQSEIGIINADDAYAERLQALANCPTVTVGVLREANVQAREIEDRGLEGCQYLYKSAGPTFLAEVRLPGLYQVYNSLLALTAAITLGVRPCDARRYLTSCSFVDGRMERVANAPRVYIDYAHTPEALACVLRLLRSELTDGGALYTVFGCGGERDRSKRPHMAAIAEQYATHSFITADNDRGEDPTQILTDIMAGFRSEGSYTVVPCRTKAIETALNRARQNDTVLIAGKGHERYTIDRSGRHPYDERKIVARVLKQD